MALVDYTPALAWFADALTDLDIPTGTTPSNPGGLSSPTIAGAGDQYADFDGSDNISFLPASPLNEVGAGDITIVMKARIDTFTASDILWDNFDGSGAAGSAHGLRIDIASGVSRTLRLSTPPRSSSFALVTSNTALAAGQDFIVAFRRSSGTWTLWLDADASGGMAADTPSTNSIGSSAISECGDVTFGSDRSGAGPTDMRLYWLVSFDAAINDTDIQLADWDDETNLKSAWLGVGGGSILPLVARGLSGMGDMSIIR